MDEPVYGENVQVGRVLSRAFQVIGRNPALFIGLGILFAGLPQAAGVWAIGGDPMNPKPNTQLLAQLINIVSLIGSAILSATVIRATTIDLAGGRPSIGEAISSTVTAIPAVIGISILYWLAVMFGAMLLLVPGLIAIAMWSVSVPAYLEERKGVFAAMSRSRDLTRGSRWKVLGLMLVSVVLLMLLSLAVLLVTNLGTATTMLVSLVTGGLAGAIFAAIIATLYVELRQVKEGAGAERLAEIFA